MHKEQIKNRLKISLIRVSNTWYNKYLKGEEHKSESTKIFIDKIKEKGHELVSFKIVPDNLSMIKEAFKEELNKKIDAVFSIGGTGIAKRDVTIEAVKELIEKEIEGFGEIFRYVSYKEIGINAMLSRALAGVSKDKIIVCLPGSPNAVKTALDLILEILPHMVFLVKEVGEEKPE